MTPGDWEEFEARVWREAVTTLWDPLVTELMGASHQDRTPGTLEDLRLSILGDPDFNGPVILRTQREGQNLQLRFMGDDLDRVEWRELSNVVLFDVEEQDFRTLVAMAKHRLDSRRGYLTPSLYPMPTWMYNDLLASVPEKEEPIPMRNPTKQLRLYPDEALSQVCEAVPLDRDLPRPILRLARDMAALMYAEEGVGLAAPQRGEHWRVVVWDTSAKGVHLQYLVNPKIVESFGSALGEEGCLSFPGLRLKVKRARRVVVEAFDLDRQPLRIEAEGWDAAILQHEIDHLDGKTFLDRVPAPTRKRALKRWRR